MHPKHETSAIPLTPPFQAPLTLIGQYVKHPCTPKKFFFLSWQVEYLSGESAYLGSELVGGYIKGVHSKNDP